LTKIFNEQKILDDSILLFNFQKYKIILSSSIKQKVLNKKMKGDNE